MRQQHFAVKNVLLAARRNKTYYSTIIILISCVVYSEITVVPTKNVDTVLPHNSAFSRISTIEYLKNLSLQYL